jgi:hypothetical protein
MRLRQKAGMLGAGMVGGLIAAVVLMTLPAMGVTGGSFILGRSNTAENRTALKGATETANLRVENTGDKPALSLATSSDAPPMAVNSKKKVTNLNADTVDGLDSVDLNDADTLDGLDSADLNDADTIDGIDSADIAHGLVIVHDDVPISDNESYIFCPDGMAAISGGAFAGMDIVISSSLPWGDAWEIDWIDPANPENRFGGSVDMFAVCAPETAVSGWPNSVDDMSAALDAPDGASSPDAP